MTVDALIPVRSGILPVGSGEVAAEADGRCLLIGSDCRAAAKSLATPLDRAVVVEVGPFQPRRWASLVAAVVGADDHHLLLPHSPDGRDLAPHLAAALDRPMVAGATALTTTAAVVARRGGLTMETLALRGPVVATFQIGTGRPAVGADGPAVIDELEPPVIEDGSADAVHLIEELPPDPDTMDLAEAARIVAGGAGLGSAEHIEVLEEIASALGASVGGTRVVTDWGWLPADRQIGTTGVAVDPDLYLAVGISGAVQHTAGLGNPEHVVVVNTDPSCPMMELADLAIVCDGPAFLDELRSALLSRRS